MEVQDLLHFDLSLPKRLGHLLTRNVHLKSGQDDATEVNMKLSMLTSLIKVSIMLSTEPVLANLSKWAPCNELSADIVLGIISSIFAKVYRFPLSQTDFASTVKCVGSDCRTYCCREEWRLLVEHRPLLPHHVDAH